MTKLADGLEWLAADDYPIEALGGPQSWDMFVFDTNKRSMAVGYSEAELIRTSVMAEQWGALAGTNGAYHAYGRSMYTSVKTRSDLRGANTV